MKVFEIKRTTRHTETERKAYGYVEPETVFYQSLCYSVYLFGLRLFRWSYFTEEMPVWAMMQYRCMGFTDWKSERPDLIDYHIANKIVVSF